MAEPERKLVKFVECGAKDCPARSYVLTLDSNDNNWPWCKHHYERHEIGLLMNGHKVAIDDRPWLFWAESRHQRGVKRTRASLPRGKPAPKAIQA